MTLEEKVDHLVEQMKTLQAQMISLQQQMEPLTNFKIGATAIWWFLGCVVAVGTLVTTLIEVIRK